METGMGVNGARRRLLKGAAAAGVVGTALGPARAADRARRPNVLFIMADDLGYADLSCTGRREYRTPRIDSIAARGLMLTQGYANSAVCSATRTGLITGRYQYRLRCGLDEPISFGDVGLPPDHPTLASLFAGLGYRTALVGKWHLGGPDGYGPLKSGYQHFFGFIPGGVDYFLHRINLTQKVRGDGLYEGETPVEKDGYLTDLLGDRAVVEIEAARKEAKPFFVSLHFNAPHWPWEGPEDEAVARQLKGIQHLDGGNLATYAKMVTRLDANVGKVLDAIQRLGMAEDTIVVFTSDNGGERFSDTWPFSGVKGELLEGGMRVPVLVRWPRRIRPGGRSDQVIVSMDWLPTLLAAAGGAPDPRYPPDGENLLPVLLGQARPHPRTLYWRYKANAQAAMREGDWKYLKLGGKEHLYDLAADVRERADLKDREPERFARMKAAYAMWNAGMLPYPANSPSHDPKLYYADRY
jgi:arylsulfatase A-like enzyme